MLVYRRVYDIIYLKKISDNFRFGSSICSTFPKNNGGWPEQQRLHRVAAAKPGGDHGGNQPRKVRLGWESTWMSQELSKWLVSGL